MAGIMVGQLYAKLSLEGAASVAQGLNRIKSNVINLKSAFAALTGGIGLTMVAKDLVNTGAKCEAYRKRILAVADSAEEANAVFERISEWAGMNPVDTDDAIAAFVRLRTAAVNNAEEATKQLGNLAAVMGTTLSDAANTLVSLNTVALRSAGVMLDQTGKKARIQIGETVVYAEKKTSAIREAIIKAIRTAYAGQIDTMKDTWQGNINTMSGMWIDFKRKLMGDAGTGGPFDLIKNTLTDIRKAWEDFTKSTDYNTFIDSLQIGLSGVIVTVAELTSEFLNLAAALSKLTSGNGWKILGAYAGYKLGGGWGALAGVATGAVKDLADNNEFKRPIIESTTRKYKALADELPEKQISDSLRADIEASEALIAQYKKSLDSMVKEDKGLLFDSYSQAQLKVRDSLRSVIKNTESYLEGLYDELDKANSKLTKKIEKLNQSRNEEQKKLIEEAQKKQGTRDSVDVLDSAASAMKTAAQRARARYEYQKAIRDDPYLSLQQRQEAELSKISKETYNNTGKAQKKKTEPLTPEEQLKTAQERIKRIGAEIKYANKNYQDFTAEIDRQVKAMPEYSDAWLAWKALQTEAHEQITSKIEEDNRRIQSSEQQKYSLGLSRAQDYFQKLIGFYQDYKTKAKAATLEKEKNQYSDSAGGVMSEIYSVANDAVSKIQTKLDDGDMTAKAADEAVKSLIKAFEELGWKAPEALEKLRKSLDPVELFNEQLKTNVKEWTQSLKDGITDAIVECKSLSDVLTSIGNQIQKFALNWILWGGGTGKGLLGGLFGSLGALGARHSGGVVGADSPSFTRRFKMPKYHTGGIVGVDEEMAILKKGEGVFTKAQMDAIGNASPTMNTSVTVNVNNNGGGDMTDEQAQALGKTVKTAVQAQVAEELYKYQRQGYFRQRAGAF